MKIDGLRAAEPHRAPWRPAVGIAAQLTDAELLTLAVRQALLSQPSEARWLRYAHAPRRRRFPSLPRPPGGNKRLRTLAGTMTWLLRQTIESIFDTVTGHLDLERHHRSTPVGVLTRILQRRLALTAVIWHHDHNGQPIKRSLPAYDHRSLGIDHLEGDDVLRPAGDHELVLLRVHDFGSDPRVPPLVFCGSAYRRLDPGRRRLGPAGPAQLGSSRMGHSQRSTSATAIPRRPA